MIFILIVLFHISRFQNQRQSLRRAGRDDRLIPTGHRRSDQNQAQVVPHPHVPSQNNTTTPGAYVDDDDPPSDDPPDQDPPSNVQAQLHHNGQLDGPPLYRPIPHHASAMNPFVDASASSSNHPLHTSAFTANTSNTAASASSVHVHHQSQNPYNPQQPRQQHDAGKTTVIPGKQPVDFYFYHYDYPMETIADAKFLEHPPIQTSQHLH